MNKTRLTYYSTGRKSLEKAFAYNPDMLDQNFTEQTLSARMQVVGEDDEHNPDILDQNITAQTPGCRSSEKTVNTTLNLLGQNLTAQTLSARMQDFGEDGDHNHDILLDQNLTAQTLSS